MAEFDDYAWLIGSHGARLLEQLAEDRRPLHQQHALLRKTVSAERARLAVHQAELRRRGVEKFGALAARMFFLPLLLEQASDLWTARYKASRFNHDRPIADYCCGIGGDLAALAERTKTCGWDHDPTTVLLAEANLAAIGDDVSESNVQIGNVAAQTPASGSQWHLDPDRRASGGRTTQIDGYSPGRALIDRWLQEAPDGAVKLAPAAVTPPDWQQQCELEWISRGRECRQQIVWGGQLASAAGQRRATRVIVDRAGDWSAHSFVGAPRQASSTDQPGAVVFDPDPSLIAAGLVGSVAAEFGLFSLGPGSVYLTGERTPDEPLLTPFVMQHQLPLRTADVAKFLRATGIGRVELKVRGVQIDPHTFRRALKLRGSGDATLLLTRIGRRETALVCQRDK